MIHFMRRFIILFSLGGVALVNAIAADGVAESLKAAKLANTVFLDPIGVKNLRLKTVEVEETTFEETIFALGKIEVRPGFSAVVSSRIAGRAVKVEAFPDHKVKEGEPLVVVESRQAGNPPPLITLNAPISGLITEVSVMPGEPVDPDKGLVQIVDLASVYGIARIPENIASRVKEGLETQIRIPGWPTNVWRSKIEHIGGLADRESGTLEAAFHIENADFKLRPGMRAEFSIVTGLREGVMSVPKQALQGEASNRFIYVADETVPNAFVKVPVEVGAMNDRFVEITKGLFPGDKVVTEGAYSLAFAGKGSVSLKEALDAAHGHEHNEDGSEIGSGQKSGTTDSHGSHAGESRLSPLVIFSIICNGVLLVALIFTAIGRRRAVSKPIEGGAA